MRALLSERPGPADELVVREVPEPQPGPGEVRIRVHACGVNYPDVLLIEDKYQLRPPRPFSPGIEVSGVIDEIGPDVSGLAPGMRVAAYPGHGGMAEKVVARQEHVFPLPAGLPFDEAAAMLVTYGTSLHALRGRAALKSGETALILGASGGVGYAAVELAKAMGARVVAAVSSEQKAEVVRRRGADDVIVYPAHVDEPRAMAQLFKAACPNGADVIFDPVGGPYAEPALRAIAWEGRYLVVGFPAGVPHLPANLVLLKGCQIVGVFWGASLERDPAHHASMLAELFRLHGEGHVRPLISSRYSLERAGEAIAALGSRTAVGKLIVTM